MTLRRRLLVGLLVLLAAGLTGAGFVTTHLLRQRLVDEKDRQLVGMPRLVNGRLERGGPPGGGSPRGIPLGAGVIYEQYDLDGTLVARLPSSLDEQERTFSLDINELVAGHPFTATDNLGGSNRVIIQDGSRGRSLVAISLDDVDRAVRSLVRVELAVALGVLLAMGVISWAFVWRELRPLDRMTDTAVAIANGDMSARVDHTDGRTEVGKLGTSLNTMLERIESAFAERAASEARLRRFVADASHELRTPLTSIRGYAELMRSGIISEADDRRAALVRVEAEAARMGSLVEDLLLLARMDQGRPMQFQPVDLSRIAEDVLADARAADPDRTWTLAADAPAVVAGDESRLRQVLANFVANARLHTPAGSPVEISVRSLASDVELAVRDHGRGVAPAEAERIFERFTRLDEGRSRDAGGTGLGLSIVQAIVESHGGSVGVRPASGVGAEFWARVPVVRSVITSRPTPVPPPSG